VSSHERSIIRLESMTTLDPQLFFRINETLYLDRLVYEPKRVNVLEIIHLEASVSQMTRQRTTALTHMQDGLPLVEPKSLDPDELEGWLDKVLMISTRFSLVLF
jgi:hypothetical protein